MKEKVQEMNHKLKFQILYGNEDFIRQHTRREIMEAFNLDYNTVNNFCTRNNIKPIPERKRTKIDDLPEGFAEYAKCHTISQIGQHYNFDYHVVFSICCRYNISYLRVKVKKPFDTTKHYSMKRTGEAQDMIKELSKTFSYASIARVFGYSKERVRQICMED